MNKKHEQSRCINLVLCHYYLSTQKLNQLLHRLLSESRFTFNILVVLNDATFNVKHDESLSGRVTFIKGNNTLFDFSAYLQGVDALSPEQLQNGVLFLNDSLFRKHPYQWILQKVMLDVAALADTDVPIAVGFGAPYEYFLQRNPWSGESRHLCSACFFANEQTVHLLRRLIGSTEEFMVEQAAVTNPIERHKNLRAVLGQKFYAYLELLLFSPNANTWQPEKINTDDNLRLLRKALCFFLEHRLSGEIEINGGGLIFINRGKSKPLFQFLLYAYAFNWKIWQRIAAITK